MASEEKIIIEEAKAGDLPEVVKIEEASFSDPWSYNMFKSELSNPLSHTWIARDMSGVLVGYICFWLIEGEAHVLNLAVHPLYRRKGIGSGLINTSLEYWKKLALNIIYLEVRESNKAALRLYERFGFRMISRRPKYYRNPKEDAYVMGLEITY